MRLEGKTALVTGGSRGIGKAIAKTYAKEGASVIICGRDEQALLSTCHEISQYGKIEYIRTNISDRSGVKILSGQVEKKWTRHTLEADEKGGEVAAQVEKALNHSKRFAW